MPSRSSTKPNPRYSVCATNYNCAHALTRHLESVFRAFGDRSFEYIVVDNQSRDGSWEILRDWAANRAAIHLLRRKCTMGQGRNLAVAIAGGSRILIVDTDVVYRPDLLTFVEKWEDACPEYAVQMPFLGLFPRGVWESVGGRRSLNTYEDVDMWLRVHALGKMRWYPVPAGENLKEPEAHGGGDYASHRYPRWERIFRLLRRELDLWKTRDSEGVDIEGLIRANTVDLGMGATLPRWVTNRPAVRPGERGRVFGRLLFQVLRG